MPKTITITDAVILSGFIQRVQEGTQPVKYFCAVTIGAVDSNGTVIYRKDYEKELTNAQVVNGLDSVYAHIITLFKTAEGI